MRISKSAPNLLKKAATSVKSTADALRTKLIFVASLRRRLAMVCAMSRQIRALITSNGREKQARVDHGSKALMMHKAMATSKEPAGDHGGKIHLGLFEVAMFEEGYHGYPDSPNSLFDDDSCYNDEEDFQDDDHDDLDVDAFDETSVIEIIRGDREGQGLEFNMEDDIDEACEMFIRRCRGRMNLSF
ncbi:hypothetical protein SETIT_2G269900v2 [Setaria italica]|uniref:Uncharacterized protein n=1 Tax=Setaria italica TaxID=4555 RepID=K4A1I1_SETIT|nr:hypothetical protein SETIT_2G269900v2 [Setaria italica]